MKRTEQITEIQTKFNNHLKNAPPAFSAVCRKAPPVDLTAVERISQINVRRPLVQLTEALLEPYLESVAACFAELRPVGYREQYAVQQIANAQWEIGRAEEIEFSIYESAYLALEAELGRLLNYAEMAQAETLAWVRDCHGPRLFHKLDRQRARLDKEFTRQMDILDCLQITRLKRVGDAFDLASCEMWLWCEEMLFILAQLTEAYGTHKKLAA